MTRRDDAPGAGLLGAVATAIAIVLPGYIAPEVRAASTPDGSDNRFVSCRHGAADEAWPVMRVGRSATANRGRGGIDDALWMPDGASDAPDEIGFSVELARAPGLRHALVLVEAPITAWIKVTMDGESHDARSIAIQDRRELVEVDARGPRIDVTIHLTEADGTRRIADLALDGACDLEDASIAMRDTAREACATGADQRPTWCAPWMRRRRASNGSATSHHAVAPARLLRSMRPAARPP